MSPLFGCRRGFGQVLLAKDGLAAGRDLSARQQSKRADTRQPLAHGFALRRTLRALGPRLHAAWCHHVQTSRDKPRSPARQAGPTEMRDRAHDRRWPLWARRVMQIPKTCDSRFIHIAVV